MAHPLDTAAALLELAAHRVATNDDPLAQNRAAAHTLVDLQLHSLIISGGTFETLTADDPRSAQQLVRDAWTATDTWTPMEPSEQEFLTRLFDLAHP